MFHKILSILILFFILSCNKSENLSVPEKILPQDILNDLENFEKANIELENKNYDKSIEHLEIIEIYFPNSEYALKSKLLSGYIYFLKEEYEKTRIISDNFIKYYPSSKEIPYAHYLNAMTHYVLIKKPNFSQKESKIAKNKFNFIINAYPESEYTNDILFKINIINNVIADHLMIIGKYYEEEKDYISSLKYYLEIYKEYDQSLNIEEVLYLITNNYLNLEENDSALKYAAILGYNYPEGSWYKKSYNLLTGKIQELEQNEKWYNKLNPIRLMKKNKKNNEKEDKWYEPKKPIFKIF